MSFFAGLDWGARGHAVCIIDERGNVQLSLDVRHDAAGLAELLARLRRVAPPEALPIAIERPSGLIVETLVAAGHPVVPIHPNAVKACRPRYRAAGGKSDPGDAYMLADILRTDGHRFRPLTPVSDAVKALRALVRGRDDLVAARLSLANQLRSLLESFWPGAAAIFADVDSPIALAFLARFPTPESARRLGPSRMRAFMAQHRYSGRRSAQELLARLHAAPKGLAGDAEADAKAEMVRALIRALGPLVAAIRELSSRIEHAVGDLPDGRIVMSFPRAGRICAAAILAELGDVRERFQTDAQLAAEAGVAPVTHASGKSRGVVFRWACNHRLRAAITCWADNSRHSSPWADHVYRRARGRGCDHPHAIRVLARAWLRILWRAWTNRTPYDPERHNAAQALAHAAGG
jgi:transposase